MNFSLNHIPKYIFGKKKNNKLLLSAKFDNFFLFNIFLIGVTFVDLNLDLKRHITINSISLTHSANIWDRYKYRNNSFN